MYFRYKIFSGAFLEFQTILNFWPSANYLKPLYYLSLQLKFKNIPLNDFHCTGPEIDFSEFRTNISKKKARAISIITHKGPRYLARAGGSSIFKPSAVEI